MSAANEHVSELANKPSQDSIIGAFLIRANRLRKEDVLKIMKLQRKRLGLRFGDAAAELGLLSREEFESALAANPQEPPSPHDNGSGLSKEILAVHDPRAAATERLRGVRTRLIDCWFDPPDRSVAGKTLAVTSIERAIGRSWLAANLAVTFAQLGRSTVLLDSDLRNPRQHAIFGIDNRHGLTDLLCRRVTADQTLKTGQVLSHLSVVPAGPVPSNPQELLGSPEFGQLIRDLEKSTDVLLIDTSADSEAHDGRIVARAAGGVLLLVKQHVTSASDLQEYSRALQAAGSSVALGLLVE